MLGLGVGIQDHEYTERWKERHPEIEEDGESMQQISGRGDEEEEWEMDEEQTGKKRNTERQDKGRAREGDGNQENKKVTEINIEKWAVGDFFLFLSAEYSV